MFRTWDSRARLAITAYLLGYPNRGCGLCNCDPRGQSIPMMKFVHFQDISQVLTKGQYRSQSKMQDLVGIQYCCSFTLSASGEYAIILLSGGSQQILGKLWRILIHNLPNSVTIVMWLIWHNSDCKSPTPRIWAFQDRNSIECHTQVRLSLPVDGHHISPINLRHNLAQVIDTRGKTTPLLEEL